jgi:hypothetical protein
VTELSIQQDVVSRFSDAGADDVVGLPDRPPTFAERNGFATLMGPAAVEPTNAAA